MADLDMIVAVGSLLSGLGAIITALIIYFKMQESNKITREALLETKKSNRLELIKNKPKFIIENASYEFQDGHIWLHANLINSGNTSADNVRYGLIVKSYFFGEEMIQPSIYNDDHFFRNHLGSVSNDQAIRIDPSSEFPLQTETICMALWLMYDFFEEKDYEEIHLIIFEKGVSPHKQITITDDNIKEIRQLHKFAEDI